MNMRKRCLHCGHRAVLLAGRCTQPGGSRDICGCTCAVSPVIPRQRTASPVTDEAVRVLRAVAAGHTHGAGVIAASGVGMTAVYAILRRHREAGLLERTGNGRGCHPHRYELTGRGRILLEAADAAYPFAAGSSR